MINFRQGLKKFFQFYDISINDKIETYPSDKKVNNRKTIKLVIK